MKKFNKGFTYLVKANGKWYVVQQTSIKRWDALVFSHVLGDYNENKDVALHGNAMSLLSTFENIDPNYEVTGYGISRNMRQEMFNVLKYGTIYVPQKIEG